LGLGLGVTGHAIGA
jgi:hypothetical protein